MLENIRHEFKNTFKRFTKRAEEEELGVGRYQGAVDSTSYMSGPLFIQCATRMPVRSLRHLWWHVTVRRQW